MYYRPHVYHSKSDLLERKFGYLTLIPTTCRRQDTAKNGLLKQSWNTLEMLDRGAYWIDCKKMCYQSSSINRLSKFPGAKIRKDGDADMCWRRSKSVEKFPSKICAKF